MELRTKLKICVALSVIALILKIIATASPGWTVVHTKVYFDPKEDIMPEDDGLHVDDLPEMRKPQKERVTISFGLWYYRVCKCGRGDDDDDDSSEEKDSREDVAFEKDEVFNDMDKDDEDHDGKRHHHKKHHHHGKHKCYFRSYHHCDKKKHDAIIDREDKETDGYDIPVEFKPASEFIKRSVEVARHARHELAWYAAVGLVLGLIGLIGAVFYARRGGIGKHPGRLACSTQILSAFFFWMAIIRVASYYIMLRKMQKEGGGTMMLGLDRVGSNTSFGCPWCPWVAAVGASVMALTSLFHMMLISRDRNCQRSEYSFHTHNDKIPIIAPRGYDHLVIPPMYEEAGPLPEKKVIP